jgi:DNA-directed RNA polymerase specialized sigma24 family protein
MTRARENDAEDRFRRMYRDHFPSLLGYALRRTTQPEQAGDVTAETMLIAWRRIGEVPVGDDERLWLFGVARRVLANQRRGDARRLSLFDKLNQHVRAAVETAVDGAVVVQMVRRGVMAAAAVVAITLAPGV